MIYYCIYQVWRAKSSVKDWWRAIIGIQPVPRLDPRMENNRSTACHVVSTQHRMIARIRTEGLINQCPEEPIASRIEIDNHADTCVLGKNFVVLEYTGRECDVTPYSDSYESVRDVPIVTGATAWTCQETSETFILVINEALHMPESVNDTLLNPNQLRAFGCIVQDNPYIGAPLYISDAEGVLAIPLTSQGTTIFAGTRTPTESELDECKHVHLTSANQWTPSSVQFPDAQWSINEDRMTRVASVGTYNDHDDIDDGSVEGEIFNLNTINQRFVASVRVENISSAKLSAVEVSGPTTPNTFVSQRRRSDVSAQSLADRWQIGLEQAKLTLKYTTQRLVRSALLPLSRRYKADRIYSLHRLQGEWFTDTVEGRVKSKDGNRYGQIFANESYFATFYPMDSKAKAGDALRVFCNEFGVPSSLRYDGAKEQVGKKTEFQKQVRKHDIRTHVSEPDMHNQSPAEGVVREVRRKWFRIMVRKKVPSKLWDYGMRWVCEIMQRTYLRSHRIDGAVPLQAVTGETPDISEYLDFGFYDRVWYRDNAGLGEQHLGRWLGVSKHVGTQMCYHVLAKSGQVVSRSSVWCVTNLELQTESVKSVVLEYDQAINEVIGDDAFQTDGDKPDPEAWADLIENDDDFREEFFKVYGDDSLPEADNYTPEIADDCYLNMELALPRDGDGPTFGRVKKRIKDNDGNPVGVANENPILDTRMFEVEFLDGHTAAMSANAITENMFAQVDSEGNRLLLMQEISDHRFTADAVNEKDMFVILDNGKRSRKKTTVGCELLVKWKDGSETWNSLKDMKESFPIQVAEYAVNNKINERPQFIWWVPHVLKKRKAIIKKVKSKYWQRTHKFGIQIPKSVNEAKKIDAANGNTLWWDAICQEMANVRVAFEEQESVPVGHKKLGVHFIFDIKLGENYRRKARLVADGHRTETPTSITYSSVVSRDSVRIGLLIAALNELDVLSCDIQNAYLTAPCREKFYIVAGSEFGSDQGKIMKVTRALYGLKSAGASFRKFLGEHLVDMGFKPSYADPDVYMRSAITTDGFEYYEYVLCYVDDVLCISKKPMLIIKGIQDKFKLKGDKAVVPADYLGAALDKIMTVNGTTCWTQSADKYVMESIKNVENTLAEKGNKLPSKGCSTPLKHGYRPEVDVSPELGIDGLRYYQEMIGVLRWAIELGRLDILLEVSLMSAYLASPREGHLEQVLHIFAYLKQHPKRKIAFDPDHPQIDDRRFTKYDWEDFYEGVKEAIPDNAPKPRGRGVSIHCFVDANLAGNTVTRRSQTGILIFVNRAPIIWHSKRQNTVESSTFGSEIVALKNAVELIEGLRYKLRMFGVPILGPANVFCDNEAVTKNCSIPESTLKKKHHSIAYHRNREAVAAGTIRIAKEDSETNLADVFTKLLTAHRRNSLFDKFMY